MALHFTGRQNDPGMGCPAHALLQIPGVVGLLFLECRPGAGMPVWKREGVPEPYCNAEQEQAKQDYNGLLLSPGEAEPCLCHG